MNICSNKSGEKMKDFILNYFLIISIFTFLITAYDKIAAKRLPKHRIRESFLLILGILGGSVAEYLTMLLIRHKTKHKKFMAGLPIIIVLQIILIGVCIYFMKQ